MKPSFQTSCGKLLAVGAVFYTSYGLANWLAAQRAPVPEVAFAWEHGIPFWAWTIAPYWSLNLLYALAFFLCQNVRQQNRYLTQLLSAQALAVGCFLLFPLQFSWPKPPTDGLAGSLFASLAAFDRPYNQAPSLHIILVLLVGRFYWYRLPPRWRPLWAAWFFLIALSVLTTWQHHFIDIPTGLLAGALVLWAWPWQGNEAATPPWRSRLAFLSRRHRFWLLFYLLLAGVCLMLSCNGGISLWLLWPGAACLLAAAAYGRFGAAGWQKQDDGRHSLAAALLMWPLHAAAALNRRLWLHGQPLSAEVCPRLHIGSLAALKDFQVALDLCAELPACQYPPHYRCRPMLDMVPPPPAALREAADSVQDLLDTHPVPVLVCCALGYGRSAAVVLVWLLRHGGCAGLDEALACLRQARPKMVLPEATRQAVLAAAAAGGHAGHER